MPATAELRFESSPPFGPIYRSILLRRRKPFRKGQAWPAITARWDGAKVDLNALRGYRDACGFPHDGNLPLPYLHILTSPLHLSIMAHPEFRLSPLGGVHARNSILQARPIGEGESLDLLCVLQAPVFLKQGLEFSITTEARSAGELVWSSESSYLFRGKFGEADADYQPPRLREMETAGQSAEWQVPSDMGRRYAKITGDYNPIHISKILAKLFGFKRDLIHGMWSAAKGLNALPALDGSGPLRFDVIFKGPIWIGSKTTLKAETSANEQRFDLYCSGNDRPCLTAQVSRA